MPIDRAATLRNAEKLLRQGKVDQAIAEYVRVVDDQPGDWNAANVLGDLYARAGQPGKAVDQFVRIADGLSGEGFLPKAAALYKKALKVAPDHEHALLRAAEIASGQGLLADARSYLEAVVALRRAKGDDGGIAEITVRLGSLDPADVDARCAAARARAALNDLPGALSDLKNIAADLESDGRGAQALTLLQEAARLDSSDIELRAHLARRLAARGDLGAAAEYLTPETCGRDFQLLMTAAEIRFQHGRTDDGVALVRQLLDAHGDRHEAVAMLGWNVADRDADAGFRLVDLAAEAAAAQADWASAAAALQELVTRVPSHIPALMRLVEISVDGGLEATMHDAQAQLADAYLAAGCASEARFLAEDLVAREPWDRTNIERFRKALVLLGEADPDARIAERLSGESPFMCTDLFAHAAAPSPAPPAAVPQPIEQAARAAKSGTDDVPESIEIDLVIMLDELEQVAVAAPQPETRPEPDLDEVFSSLREEASRNAAGDPAEGEYRRALALYACGEIDACIEALQAGWAAPRARFAAAALLGRLYRERGAVAQAIEWLERAADASPSVPAEGHMVMYDLADLLEQSGEAARALAVCLELQAVAGEYRDVAVRIDRLTQTRARG